MCDEVASVTISVFFSAEQAEQWEVGYFFHANELFSFTFHFPSQFILNNHGIDTEESYPYFPHYNYCAFRPSRVGATVKGFVDLPKGDENALAVAVAAQGPVSVSINANPKSFRFYKYGIYEEADSSPKVCTCCVCNIGIQPMIPSSFYLDEQYLYS